MILQKWLNSLGRYLELMGRTFQRPERMRMFFKEYLKEMAQLGVNSIGVANPKWVEAVAVRRTKSCAPLAHDCAYTHPSGVGVVIHIT